MTAATLDPKQTETKISTPHLDDAFTKSVYDPVTFVSTIIQEANNLGASDILFEPQADLVRVRARIDGALYDMGFIDSNNFNPISARIKVLGKLDSAERKKIQEGQVTLELNNRTVNLRLEIAQTIHGELIVIRVHEKQTIIMELANLGFSPQAFKSYQQMLGFRNGLILVCGPTGCGKTTTLYSTLNFINSKQNYNVMTIEDPVEFQLRGVNQMAVRDDLGFSFAEGLQTILRLSPDVIFVGEIRDKTTAQTAVESGLTGHLVFSTVHASDTVGTLFRLLDLNIEKYLLNTALIGVIGQRLIRVNCDQCKSSYQPNEDEIKLFQKALGRTPKQLFRSKGCATCKKLAYKGRTGIYEVMVMNPTIRGLIRSHSPEEKIRESLKQTGFITMLQDGLQKCEQGISTVDEVMRNNLKLS